MNFYTQPGACFSWGNCCHLRTRPGCHVLWCPWHRGGGHRHGFFLTLTTMSESDNHNDNDNIATIKEDVIVYPECEEGPCLFVQNKWRLFAFDEVEHASLTMEDVPLTNIIMRKKLCKQLPLMMIKGGPVGTGARRELPTCCVSAVLEMHPSNTFMGFKAQWICFSYFKSCRSNRWPQIALI